MSSPIPSAEVTTEEFIHSVDDMREFVFSSKKRRLHDTQLKVLLRNKINRLKTNFNAFVSHLMIDSDVRSKIFFESIPKLTDVCNNISSDGIFELLWLELNAMINSFAVALITSHSKADIWRVQGSATLLVQIISGLPKIDQIPSLANHSIEDPEFLDRWRVTFNYLQFSAMAYSKVIYAVKTVKISDLIVWINEGFYYYSLLDKYFHMFEWEKIALIQKKQPIDFFIGVFTITSTFQNLLDHVFTILQRLGFDWQSEIDTYGFIKEQSFEGIISFIDYLKEYNNTALTKLNELYANGMWTENDNPVQTEPIKDLIELNTIYNYFKEYVKAFQVANEQSLNKNINSDSIENITKALELNQWYLSYTENQTKDRNNLLQSYLGSQYVDLIEQRLELLTLQAIFSNSLSLYSSEFRKLQWLFQEADPLQYSDVFLRKLIVELYIASKFKLTGKFDELYDQVVNLKEIIEFRPRDLTALIVFELILGIFLQKRNIPTQEAVLISINKNGLINGGDYHLYTEFQEYLEYLIPAFHGKTSILIDKLLRRKSSNNIFDSYSWLIPDFSHAFNYYNKIPIFYLPFNRYCDGIVVNEDYNS